MGFLSLCSVAFQVLSLGGRYIYLLGGALSSDQIHTQSSTWRYDGATGQWTKRAAMLEARSDFAAVGIGSRFILVAGEVSLHLQGASLECHDMPVGSAMMPRSCWLASGLSRTDRLCCDHSGSRAVGPAVA